jgi:hypothetical protein
MLAFNARFIAPQLRQQPSRNFYAMKTTETMTTEVIESDWYTFRELQLELARHRGKGVPVRTLQWWTQQLCISTNAYGFYELQDLRLLVRLVYWLKRNRSLTRFKTLLLQELETHAP